LNYYESSQIRRIIRFIVLIFALVVASAIPASADICFPMILGLGICSFWIIPIVLIIEALAAKYILTWPIRKSLVMAFNANAVSAIVGIPVTILLFVAAELLRVNALHFPVALQESVKIIFAAPNMLYDYDTQNTWAVPAFAAMLCVPFYFMSVGCEHLIARLYVDKEKAQIRQVKKWAWLANLFSYSFIVSYLVIKMLNDQTW